MFEFGGGSHPRFFGRCCAKINQYRVCEKSLNFDGLWIRLKFRQSHGSFAVSETGGNSQTMDTRLNHTTLGAENFDQELETNLPLRKRQ